MAQSRSLHGQAARERMLGGHHRDDTLLETHQRLKIGKERRPEHQDEIDLIVRERGHGLLVVETRLTSKLTMGWRARNAAISRGRKSSAKRLAAGDAHGAAAHALEILDLRLHPLDAAVLLAQVVDEHLAGRRQPHAARPALEQLRAELLLEIHDSPVHRRRRDVELIGGLADRTRARDLVDVSQDAQVLHRKP